MGLQKKDGLSIWYSDRNGLMIPYPNNVSQNNDLRSTDARIHVMITQQNNR